MTLRTGAHDGMLQLLPYDPGYPAAFEAMRVRLLDTLGELIVKVEHLGSTAVPNLLSKPKIDIFLECKAAPPPAAAYEALVGLGFELSTHVDKLGHHAFNRTGTPEFALHWCEIDSQVVSAARRFRMLLLTEARLRHEYQDAKLAALQAHPNDAWQYNRHKASVIRRALASAT
jgi:GrpB-like predicted nucleotidyltransferase (UPF0157 family)